MPTSVLIRWIIAITIRETKLEEKTQTEEGTSNYKRSNRYPSPLQLSPSSSLSSSSIVSLILPLLLFNCLPRPPSPPLQLSPSCSLSSSSTYALCGNFVKRLLFLEISTPSTFPLSRILLSFFILNRRIAPSHENVSLINPDKHRLENVQSLGGPP